MLRICYRNKIERGINSSALRDVKSFRYGHVTRNETRLPSLLAGTGRVSHTYHHYLPLRAYLDDMAPRERDARGMGCSKVNRRALQRCVYRFRKYGRPDTHLGARLK